MVASNHTDQDPRTITTAYLWRDTEDDLIDPMALSPKISRREATLLSAIDKALSVLAESTTGPAVEAESILRAAKRALS